MRRKNILTKTVTVGLIGSLLVTALTGCGSSEVNSTSNGDVQKIIVGSGINYQPYCYIDENGNAVGYEYDILQAIDELLPQYEFEYQSMSFDNIVLSLDAGKIDLAAHQYEYTDERAEKYLFSEEAYTSYITYITVLTEVDNVTSLADLAGEKIRTGGSTSATAQILRKWNEEHPEQEVEIISTDSSTDEETVAALKSGAAKATIITKRDAEKFNKNFGDGEDFLKKVGEPINNSQTYYLYRKDSVELQEAVDGALKTLKENGTLSELSIKWVGEDVTESE